MNIQSRSISGAEAIVIPIIRFWFDRSHQDLAARTYASSVGRKVLKYKTAKRRGEALENSGFDIDTLVVDFFNFAREQPNFRYLMDYAVERMKGDDPVGQMKGFVRDHIRDLCGHFAGEDKTGN